MGVIIPQVLTEDKASGAQIVDGSLRFDSSKGQYLKRTLSSSGNRQTWTWSGWVKKASINRTLLLSTSTNGSEYHISTIESEPSDSRLGTYDRNASSVDYYTYSAAKLRDRGWYHIVMVWDTSNSTQSERIRTYINGVRTVGDSGSVDLPTDTSFTTAWNNASLTHHIGMYNGNQFADAYFSQVYFIDGQALGPEYFGYTDPLTNTWRPKKFKPQATPNDGRTWSTNSTLTNAANAFDGSFSSSATIDTTVRTLTTETITVNNKLEIYTNNYNLQTITLNINGQNYVNINDASNEWTTVPFTGTMSGTTTIVRSAGSAALYAVRVDGVVLINGDTSNIGLNGFYLPMDGNTPIGQDQSGRGNNWTPVNFGGSNTLEKATGALPILNTDGGGKVARVGVRTDSNASSLVLALPLVGIKSDFSNAINSGTSNKAITANGDAAGITTISNFYGGSFRFDGTGDYLDTPDSSDYTFGTGNFTCEMWVYPTSSGDTDRFLGQINSGGNTTNMSFRMGRNSGTFICGVAEGSTDYTITGQNIPANKWTHLALVRDGNTLRAFQDGVQTGTTSFSGTVNDSSNKLAIGRLGESDGSYFTGYISDVRIYKGLAKYTSNFIPASTDPDILPDTPSGVSYSSNVKKITDGAVAFDGSGDYLTVSSTDLPKGSSSRTVEFFVYIQSGYSSWQNIFSYGSSSSGQCFGINVGNNDGANIAFTGYSSGDWDTGVSVRGYLNSWHHFAVTYDGTNVKIFVDGISLGSAARSLNTTGSTFCIGGSEHSGFGENFRGIISNFQVTDNVLYTSNFTPPTAPISSVANTKLLCCKSSSSATAFDVSPGTITANGNAVASNFNPFNIDINTVRGQESGWCTLNPLTSPGTNYITLSNGNLDQVALTETVSSTKGTVGVTTGKWYWECNLKLLSSGGVSPRIGICRQSAPSLSQGSGADEWILYMTDYAGYGGRGMHNSTLVGSDAPFSNGDIGMFALDMDSSKIYFGKNGIWLNGGNPVNGSGAFFTDVTGEIFPLTNTGYYSSVSMNFGQKPFKFPPPEGFQPLALANTPRPTIVRPDQYVGISTWSGTGATLSLTTGFKPDLVWVKTRGAVSNDNFLFDSVRGATKWLISNSTTFEQTGANTIISFDDKGFTTGSDNDTNASGRTFVAWSWKAGGNSNTYNINDIGYSTASAAGLTAGTITPTGASVNTKSGFSIITYTGPNDTNAHSFSHGLGKKPSFIIIKNRDSGFNWDIYHSSLGYNSSLIFTTAATRSGAYSAEPDSTLVNVQWNYTTYQNQRYVAYSWAEIPGFSKFGSYTGNGSADGPVIVTGFKPRWLLIKQSSASGENWRLFDTSRDLYNPTQNRLIPNLSVVEAVGVPNELDLLSNGFKLRSTDNASNGSSTTYIYAAFAEAPTFNLYGGQSTAR